MLSITELTYRIAGRTLLDSASAQIPDGWKVGLVGRNGTGKSTLLALVSGELQPDGGSIDMKSKARIGLVAQEAPGGDKTPIEIVLDADTERAALLHEAETSHDGERLAYVHSRLDEIGAHAAPARAAAILAGLGFDEPMQHRPMSFYSGGWRMRAALAAALFSEPDLLLLDEPTNHLDLEATAWLETYLQSYPRTLLIVSHDRRLLNVVPDHILHLDHNKLTLFTGGYDSFEAMRAERLMQSKAEAAKQEARRKHLQSFVDRFGAKASKARQAQSRVKMLARMTPSVALAEDTTLTFDFPAPPPLRPPLLSIDKVAVGYEPGKAVLRNLDLRIDPEDRIALLGANGNGKSTLAKLLAGRLDPQSGERTASSKLGIGFFAQHQVDEMAPDDTAFALMGRLMPAAKPQEVRARLGRFGFSDQKVFVKVKDLSGGERARLNFAAITYAAPSLLILDEPTNHLDIGSREALANAINDFPGAVMLISHDWHFLELTADQLWLVADGGVTQYDGDLEDYRKSMLAARSSFGVQDTWDDGDSKKARRAANARKKQLDPLRRAAREAEAAMDKLVAERQVLEAKLAGHC
jgi:ATP-binding cassette subfamily F protein 3